MKKSKSKRVFDIFNYGLLGVILIVTLYPILNQVAISLSSASGILRSTVTIFPKDFTLETYKGLIEQRIFWKNYANTIIYAVFGTALSLAATTLCGYALSKKDVFGSGILLRLIVFTMFFAGGLIPNFVLIRNLGMIDTIWAIILPGAILPYNVLLMRTYFMWLPYELEEASKIDGMGQFGYFMKIALPLSKPIIATITLFIFVVYWNDWFSALMYLNDQEMQPVTLYLRNMMMGATMAAQSGDMDSAMQTIPQSVPAASMVLVITPIICVYPFVQKHFVKGVMIGAIKG